MAAYPRPWKPVPVYQTPFSQGVFVIAPVPQGVPSGSRCASVRANYPPLLHQCRKLTVLTERIGAFAEIADDLDESLLHRGGAQQAWRCPAKQPLPGKAQQRVIFGGCPGKVTLLDLVLHIFVLALGCS